VGVDFATQFTVPVFVTGETAAPPEAGAPLLEEYQPLTMDGVALRECGLRREGDTFYFSASHLPGTKLVTGVLSVGILVLLAWYVGRGIPGIVWGITLFVGLIIGLMASGVWFARYELKIEAGDVVVTKPRPWGTKVIRMPREEVRLIEREQSMSVGQTQYFRLNLVGPEGVDPGATAQPKESFRVRKLRYQLEQLQKQGNLTPGKAAEMGAAIVTAMKAAPKFIVPFCQHIPGQARAEAIADLVLQAIRGEK